MVARSTQCWIDIERGKIGRDTNPFEQAQGFTGTKPQSSKLRDHQLLKAPITIEVLSLSLNHRASI